MASMSTAASPPPVASVRQAIESYLLERLGSVRAEDPDGFSCRKGTTRVYVTVTDGVATASTLVQVMAPLAIGVMPSIALFEYVGRRSDDFFIGSISVKKRDDSLVDLVFVHTLVGDHLHREDLMVVMDVVAATADGLDEAAVATFGGTMAHDERCSPNAADDTTSDRGTSSETRS